MAAFHQEASKLCQCHCHRGGVDRTCGTPSAAQTGNRTPVLKNKGGIDSLPYPSVEASTGQLEIKSVTPDQGEVKGLVTNQTYVNTLDQGTVPMFDQKDVKVVVPDQGVVKDPASDQKEIIGQICCDNINSCDGRNNINTPSPAVKSENQGEVIDLSKDDDDDDDFKPPKKKYRVVGVC